MTKSSMMSVFGIVLFSAVIGGFVSGCGGTSSAMISSSSNPADLGASVIIPDKLLVHLQNEVRDMQLAGNENVHWVVRTNIKNKTYNNAITDNVGDPRQGGVWKVVSKSSGNESWAMGNGAWSNAPSVSISTGKTGEMYLYFVVPRTFKVENTELIYTGQEPYSSCKLLSGEKVIAYDWTLKKVTEGASPSSKEVVSSTSRPIGDLYTIDLDTSGLYRGEKVSTKRLNTIGSWEGTGDKILTFTTDKSPVVINFEYVKTSSIASAFSVGFRDERANAARILGYTILFNGNIIQSTGKIELSIKSSGCNWKIKVGVE